MHRVDGPLVVNDDVAVLPCDRRLVTVGPQQLTVNAQRTFEFNRSDGAWQINSEFFDENRINAKPTRGTAVSSRLSTPGTVFRTTGSWTPPGAPWRRFASAGSRTS